MFLQLKPVRKRAYEELLAEIRATKTWTARLLTVEVGARGLVGLSTYRAFVTLGLSSRQANALCKQLSEIVARCSYAIYLAHNSPTWPHNDNLVEISKPLLTPSVMQKPNIVTLREKGIKVLYHFTDPKNVESICKNGLMSASTLKNKGIAATLNSDSSRAGKLCATVVLLEEPNAVCSETSWAYLRSGDAVCEAGGSIETWSAVQ